MLTLMILLLELLEFTLSFKSYRSCKETYNFLKNESYCTTLDDKNPSESAIFYFVRKSLYVKGKWDYDKRDEVVIFLEATAFSKRVSWISKCRSVRMLNGEYLFSPFLLGCYTRYWSRKFNKFFEEFRMQNAASFYEKDELRDIKISKILG